MLPRRIPTALAALLLAGCATAGGAAPAPRDPAAAARAADDGALAASAAERAALEGHWVAVAGGAFLGGAWSREDARALLAGVPAAADHAYLFAQGTEGDLRVNLPALWAPRVAGNGLLAALGLEAAVDPAAGTVVLSRGGRTRTFVTEGGPVAVALLFADAGEGEWLQAAFVLSTGFPGTAVLTAADGAAAGLHRCEIPGTATLVETLHGRSAPHRRALARVALPGWDDEPEARPSAVIEVLYPR